MPDPISTPVPAAPQPPVVQELHARDDHQQEQLDRLKKIMIGIGITLGTAIAGALTSWVANGSPNPFTNIVHKVEIVKMPAIEGPEVKKVLIDPSILTDDQKKKIETVPKMSIQRMEDQK